MLDRFIKYLKNEKNYSRHTQIAYRSDIQSLSDFLNTEYELDLFHKDEVADINGRMLRSWMGELMEQGVSKRSVARKMASANSYFRFLKRSEVLENNPAANIKAPKYEKRLPAFLKEGDTQTLFDVVVFADDFEGIRDKCIMETLYGCGLRRSELIGLQYSDINFSHATFKVLGKGGKERIVPFGEHVRASMKAYMKACDEQGVSYRDNFLVRANGDAVYPKMIYNLVKRYLDQACTISRKSPHVMRHTFATHLLNAGADLNAIKELLGHSSLAATQVYLHNSISKLKNVYQKAHPKA